MSLFPRTVTLKEKAAKTGSGGGQAGEELVHAMLTKVLAQLWHGRMLGLPVSLISKNLCSPSNVFLLAVS